MEPSLVLLGESIGHRKINGHRVWCGGSVQEVVTVVSTTEGYLRIKCVGGLDRKAWRRLSIPLTCWLICVGRC